MTETQKSAMDQAFDLMDKLSDVDFHTMIESHVNDNFANLLVKSGMFDISLYDLSDSIQIILPKMNFSISCGENLTYSKNNQDIAINIPININSNYAGDKPWAA